MKSATVIFSVFATLFYFNLAHAETAAPIVHRLPNNPNPIQGACKNLREAAGEGVKDTSGRTHKGACGFTEFVPLFDGMDFDTYLAALGSGAVNPMELELYNETPTTKCARFTGFNVELSGNTEVSFLNWLHNKPANSKCSNEWDRLKKVILDHEDKHVGDAMPVLTKAHQNLTTMQVTVCAAGDYPRAAAIETGLRKFKAIAEALVKQWDELSAGHDKEGDLCDINCCECSDASCYAGGFKADSISPTSLSFTGAKAQHIEMSLSREDKDSKGRVLQQFYTLERGEFIYPDVVTYGEFDCKLNQTVFPLRSTSADMTLFFNSPNFAKNSYSMGFSTEGNPVGTCHLRSNPNVVITIPFPPFTFGLLTECSNYKTVPFNNVNLLQGIFPHTCSDTTTTADWLFKLNN